MQNDLPTRLTLSCAHAGLTDSALAAACGVSRAYMSEVRNGKSKGGRLLESAAKILGVDPGWLATGEGSAPDWWPGAKPESRWPHTWAQTDEATDEYRVPILGTAAAAQGHRVDGHEESGHVAVRPHWQAIVIRGHSGEPVVLSGQTVLVDPRLKAKKNALVVIDSADGPLLKRYVGQAEGKLFLASIHHGIDSIILDASTLRHQPFVVVGVLFTDEVAK